MQGFHFSGFERALAIAAAIVVVLIGGAFGLGAWLF